MPLSPLHGLAASALALIVATSTGVVLAAAPAASEVTIATPATPSVDPVALAAAEREERINSRAAEREALASQVSTAAQARAAALVTTSSAIIETEVALQKRIAEEKAAAARKAAEEKAAAEKKAAQERAAADEAKKQGYIAGSKPREIARQMAQNMFGWGEDQFQCYDNIIMRESEWIVTADNPTSSAYGIPQALPGNRMASEGTDWRTNPATQIRWGLKYVKDRYGSPCKAWSFKRANGWY